MGTFFFFFFLRKGNFKRKIELEFVIELETDIFRLLIKKRDQLDTHISQIYKRFLEDFAKSSFLLFKNGTKIHILSNLPP